MIRTVEFDSRAISESLEAQARRAPLARKIVTHFGTWKARQALRDFYADAHDEIMAAEPHEWGIDTYEVDWIKVFTPIERALWHDIRSEGAVLYPQNPVGRYFADFCNPKAGVIIECDGRAWHADKKKDKARDAELRALGFKTYRIRGTDCFSEPLETEDGIEPGEALCFIRRVCRARPISPKWFSMPCVG